MARVIRGGSEGRRTALITGASSGIGAELVRVFAANGHDLVLVARREARLADLAKAAKREHGTHTTIIAADLTEPGAPARVVEATRSQGIAVDYLVNNAGRGLFGAFSETDLATEMEMVQVNLVALTRLTKLYLTEMVARRRGRVLNVASTAAFQPGPFMAVYYATKAYVLSLSEALAEELGESGVTVTALCPGPVPTEFQDVAGMQASPLAKAPMMMPAEPVAQAAYDGMMAGKRLVIPGVMNSLLVQSVRVAPRTLTSKIVRRMQEKRKGKRR